MSEIPEHVDQLLNFLSPVQIQLKVDVIHGNMQIQLKSSGGIFPIQNVLT